MNENIHHQYKNNINDYNNNYQNKVQLISQENNLDYQQKAILEIKVPQILSSVNQEGENIIAALNNHKIYIGSIDILSLLGSNLDNEFSRIKNKYNLNDDDSENFQQVIPNIKDSLDIRALCKNKNKNGNKN
jgi:hypothetical protein